MGKVDYFIQRLRCVEGRRPELEIALELRSPHYPEGKWRTGGRPVLLSREVAEREAGFLNSSQDGWVYSAAEWRGR